MAEGRITCGEHRSTYPLKQGGVLLRPMVRQLPGAVPPYVPVSADVHSVRISADRSFGWVSGGLPSPFKDDVYVVEFAGEGEVAPLAYIDRFGRAFSCIEPTVAPPARTPDMTMVRFPDSPSPFEEHGCFMVEREVGDARMVARYRKVADRYEIYDSWFDFGVCSSGLTYADCMARVYLACVFRPALTGIPVPDTGLAAVDDLLAAPNLVQGLRAFMVLLDRIGRDGALRPPALAERLEKWLAQAGFTERASYEWLNADNDASGAGPLRLVRLAQTSNLFFLSRRRENSPIDARTVWAMESALNRYLLLKQKLGEKASSASMAEVAHWDDYLREHVALQAPHASHPLDEGLELPFGEWEARRNHAHGMEMLRVPFRFEAAFHTDVAQPGVAAWMVMAPDAQLMPLESFDEETGEWVLLSREEREAMALAYGRHLALALAAVSFNATRAIERVTVSVRPFTEASDMTSPLTCQVTFGRAQFVEKRAYRVAAAGDPTEFLLQCGERILNGVPTEGPFASLIERPSYGLRLEAPELASVPLPEGCQEALGAANTSQLRISYDAEMMQVAEALASQLQDVSSAAQAVAVVRQRQWDTGSPLVYKGCTRLMTALTAGDLDPGDAHGVRCAFLGESELARALEQARALAPQDADGAADLLISAVRSEEGHHRWHDSAEVVYRLFDSYTARVLYNREYADGRPVELVPPTLLMALLEVVNLLDESFQRFEEAVSFAERVVQMAPTSPYAYCRCARAYALSGGFDAAEQLLKKALDCAFVPEEIALAYYQLGYVEGKLGRPQVGLACYNKSLEAAPVYAVHISAEVHSLLADADGKLVPRGQEGPILAAADIPEAPAPGRLAQLRAAAQAAVDANVFTMARPLLGLYLHYFPDDELTDLLQSLGDPRIDELLEA